MHNVTKVKCVQASQCSTTGKKIFTLEMEYPRVIHSQLLTHGVFSKNSSSTRAVPLKAAIAQLVENPAEYVWTKNQSGMQGEVIPQSDHKTLNRVLEMARNSAISFAEYLNDAEDTGGLGVHKQNAGRLLEPFQNIKIVLTSTEWKNWDWLRYHPDAQGEISDLAVAMKEARDNADVMIINKDEWHVPYVERLLVNGNVEYRANDETISSSEAKLISSSVCAQLSYRKADTSLQKAIKMSGMLIDGERVHASPFEHQATPVSKTIDCGDFAAIFFNLPSGVTHVDVDGTICSANFKQWIQHRQLIKNHDGEKLSD